MVAPGQYKRKPSGILGLLVKLHYPGVIQVGQGQVVATTWEHYIHAQDALDLDSRIFQNKAERVVEELWVSLRRTRFLNTLYSLIIIIIMTRYVSCVRRTSTGVPRDTWTRRGPWLMPNVLNS
jgi:hypothetical protein